MSTELKVGEIVMLNGIMMKHVGGGNFVPMPTEVLAKRFDAGGPIAGAPVAGQECS